MRLSLALPLLLASAAPVLAQTVDMAGVEAKIADLEPNYGLILSDISCDAPTIPAHQILCDSGESAGPDLWRMARLDDLAWVYAVENATGQEVSRENPPRDDDFIARRDACTDAECIAALLIEHTNDSLGGMSPYPQ